MKRLPLLILMLLIVCQCAERRLIPGAQAIKVRELKDAALQSSSGVKILVETNAWTGFSQILDKITPLRVTIINNSGSQLRIQYNHFSIKEIRGVRLYAALPPYEFICNGEETKIVLPYPFPIESQIEYDKFSVAPYCARMYEEIPEYKNFIGIDSVYYEKYYTVWAKIQLPIIEMLQNVLPEGVLENGGHVGGFVYFEKLDRRERALLFTVDLIEEVGGKSLGTLKIPFELVK